MKNKVIITLTFLGAGSASAYDNSVLGFWTGNHYNDKAFFTKNPQDVCSTVDPRLTYRVINGANVCGDAEDPNAYGFDFGFICALPVLPPESGWVREPWGIDKVDNLGVREFNATLHPHDHAAGPHTCDPTQPVDPSQYNIVRDMDTGYFREDYIPPPPPPPPPPPSAATAAATAAAAASSSAAGGVR